MKILPLLLLFLVSCSSFDWDEVEIQGIKKDRTLEPKTPPLPPDPRLNFIGNYKFVGANIERGADDLVEIKTCPKDSLFIQLNDFDGLSLTFREKGQYFYESVFFLNKNAPANWVAEEELSSSLIGNRLEQTRTRINYENNEKVYLEHFISFERVDDLLFYRSKTALYRPHKFLDGELVPQVLGELQCAYGFDSLSEEQKKAHARDMGYTVKPKYKVIGN